MPIGYCATPYIVNLFNGNCPCFFYEHKELIYKIECEIFFHLETFKIEKYPIYTILSRKWIKKTKISLLCIKSDALKEMNSCFYSWIRFNQIII